MTSRSALLAFVLVASCGGQAPGEPPTAAGPAECVAGETLLGDGSCLAAGTQQGGCAAGESLDPSGECTPAGVAPGDCAEGFAPDGEGGCMATLPPDACPPGSMAVPGETSCQELAPCAAGIWGAIPEDGATEFVDGSFEGTSDGSQANPWRTIRDGIDAAAPFAIVAVASGSYAEDLDVAGSPVRIWGRCPAQVELVGTGAQIAAIVVREGAGGTELRDLAIRGSSSGIAISGAEDVLLERVWVHDVEERGLDVEETLGPASATVRSSLFENNHLVGVLVIGSSVAIESSVIRDMQPSPGQMGHGVSVLAESATGTRGHVSLVRSVVERARRTGVLSAGSDLAIEASVVRDTSPAPDGTEGRAVELRRDPVALQSANAVIRASVLEGFDDFGVAAEGSDASIEATVLRAARPGKPTGGACIVAQDDGGATRSSITVRSSRIDAGSPAGIFVFGSNADIESVLVRDTVAIAGGAGIVVQDRPGQRGYATITSSVVERSQSAGLFVSGSEAILEGVAVRDTLPAADGSGGTGIHVQLDRTTGERSYLELGASAVVRSRHVGVLVADSDARVDGTLIGPTDERASDGLFGDGITIARETAEASVLVRDSRVEGSVRAGLAAFGARVGLGRTALACNGIDLDVEQNYGIESVLEDLGDNACGCAAAEACSAASDNLAPPSGLLEP